VAFVVDLDPCHADAADLGWTDAAAGQWLLQDRKAAFRVRGPAGQPFMLVSDLGDRGAADLQHLAAAAWAA
jgi:hypothetical protein